MEVRDQNRFTLRRFSQARPLGGGWEREYQASHCDQRGASGYVVNTGPHST